VSPAAGSSCGVPIAVSQPTPAPSSLSASSKGKKRATPEATDAETTEEEHPEPTPDANERGGVARKRSKLSIVLVEEDRVKRPTRRAKGKNKVVSLKGE